MSVSVTSGRFIAMQPLFAARDDPVLGEDDDVGVQAEDLVLDVGVQARDHRDDAHDGRDADDDAEQRQERAQLVPRESGRRDAEELGKPSRRRGGPPPSSCRALLVLDDDLVAFLDLAQHLERARHDLVTRLRPRS